MDKFRKQYLEFGRDSALQIDRLIKSIEDNVQLSQVLIAINQLDRKVDTFMSTQETRLQGIQTALTGIAEGINTLQQQVAELKANNPDMEDEIASIEATVKTIADDINGVVPTPPEPTPEG